MAFDQEDGHTVLLYSTLNWKEIGENTTHVEGNQIVVQLTYIMSIL